MKLLKILLTVLLLNALSVGAFAQLRLGAGMGFGFEGEGAFTIFARGAYDFTDKIRANLTYNYYFLEDVEVPGAKYSNNASDINLDLHYTFAALPTISFYGLAGANVLIASVDTPVGKDSNTDFGLNLGIGGLFGIADKADIVTEFKYVIGGADQLFFNAGLLFNITGSR